MRLNPPSIFVFSAIVDSTNVMASVSRPKSSPRTPRTRNTTAAMPVPSSAATSPAAGRVHRKGTPSVAASVAVV